MWYCGIGLDVHNLIFFTEMKTGGMRDMLILNITMTNLKVTFQGTMLVLKTHWIHRSK